MLDSRLLQLLDSVCQLSAGLAWLNAMALSRDDLRGMRLIKRPLLRRALQSVVEEQSDIDDRDGTSTRVTLNTGI